MPNDVVPAKSSAVENGSELFQEVPRRQGRPSIFWWFSLAVAALVLVGVINRLTVRDSLSGFSALYYATPLPLLACGAWFCLLPSLWNGHRKRTLFWSVAAIGLTGWWFQHDWRFSPSMNTASETPDKDDISVMFWNVARRQDLLPAAKYIREAQPDIVGLLEVVGNGEEWRRFWKKQFPEYDVSVLGGGIYLLCRGTSGEAHAEKLLRTSICRSIDVTIRGQTWRCIIADIEASFYRMRKVPLRKLSEFAETQSSLRTIIMGDFNTPSDSVHLASLREHFHLAFDEAGQGYAPTWPVQPLPIPFHQLDQIWLDDQLSATSCYHGWSTASDHRPVHATIRRVPAAEAEKKSLDALATR